MVIKFVVYDSDFVSKNGLFMFYMKSYWETNGLRMHVIMKSMYWTIIETINSSTNSKAKDKNHYCIIWSYSCLHDMVIFLFRSHMFFSFMCSFTWCDSSHFSFFLYYWFLFVWGRIGLWLVFFYTFQLQVSKLLFSVRWWINQVFGQLGVLDEQLL